MLYVYHASRLLKLLRLLLLLLPPLLVYTGFTTATPTSAAFSTEPLFRLLYYWCFFYFLPTAIFTAITTTATANTSTRSTATTKFGCRGTCHNSPVGMWSHDTAMGCDGTAVASWDRHGFVALPLDYHEMRWDYLVSWPFPGTALRRL